MGARPARLGPLTLATALVAVLANLLLRIHRAVRRPTPTPEPAPAPANNPTGGLVS